MDDDDEPVRGRSLTARPATAAAESWKRMVQSGGVPPSRKSVKRRRLGNGRYTNNDAAVGSGDSDPGLLQISETRSLGLEDDGSDSNWAAEDEKEEETSSAAMSPRADKLDKSAEIAALVTSALGSIQPWDIAHSGVLHDVESVWPKVEIRGFGTLKLPVDPKQVDGFKRAVRRVRTKDLGLGWAGGKPYEPAWLMPGQHITITEDSAWRDYLKRVIFFATEYLGFDAQRARIETDLHGIQVCDPTSTFRNYSEPCDEDNRIGTLAIILNNDYQGGDVAIGYGARDACFQPSLMDADKLMIVSHAHVTYDNLPLSKGYRVLMSYSLYHSNVKNNADEENSLVKELTDMTTQLELALFNQIKTWADHLRATHPGNEDRDPEAFPILFVLEGDYNQVDLAIDNLTAPDRAKAAALRNVKIRSFRGYKLQTFLVSVKATVKNYYGSSNTTVRYAVDRAASLGGMPKPKRVRDTVIDERGVAQREEFTKDAEVKRQVTESMNTTTKTRTCLMLILEPWPTAKNPHRHQGRA